MLAILDFPKSLLTSGSLLKGLPKWRISAVGNSAIKRLGSHSCISPARLRFLHHEILSDFWARVIPTYIKRRSSSICDSLPASRLLLCGKMPSSNVEMGRLMEENLNRDEKAALFGYFAQKMRDPKNNYGIREIKK